MHLCIFSLNRLSSCPWNNGSIKCLLDELRHWNSICHWKSNSQSHAFVIWRDGILPLKWSNKMIHSIHSHSTQVKFQSLQRILNILLLMKWQNKIKNGNLIECPTDLTNLLVIHEASEDHRRPCDKWNYWHKMTNSFLWIDIVRIREGTVYETLLLLLLLLRVCQSTVSQRKGERPGLFMIGSPLECSRWLERSTPDPVDTEFHRPAVWTKGQRWLPPCLTGSKSALNDWSVTPDCRLPKRPMEDDQLTLHLKRNVVYEITETKGRPREPTVKIAQWVGTHGAFMHSQS